VTRDSGSDRQAETVKLAPCVASQSGGSEASASPKLNREPPTPTIEERARELLAAAISKRFGTSPRAILLEMEKNPEWEAAALEAIVAALLTPSVEQARASGTITPEMQAAWAEYQPSGHHPSTRLRHAFMSGYLACPPSIGDERDEGAQGSGASFGPGSREPDPQAVPAASGFDPSRKLYCYAVSVRKSNPGYETYSLVQGWCIVATEDEARGRAVRVAMEAKPDFSILDVLVLQIPVFGFTLSDSDQSGEAGQTAKQSGPEGRERGAEGNRPTPKVVSDKPEGEALDVLRRAGKALFVNVFSDGGWTITGAPDVPVAALHDDYLRSIAVDSLPDMDRALRSFVALAERYVSIDDPNQRLCDTPLYAEALSSLPTDKRGGGE
jgi:hypothetical protein